MRWLILVALIMSGCTSYKENRNPDTQIEADGGSTIVIYVGTVGVETSRDTGQEAEGRGSLAQEGGVAAAATSAVLDEIRAKFVPDNSVTTEGNPPVTLPNDDTSNGEPTGSEVNTPDDTTDNTDTTDTATADDLTDLVTDTKDSINLQDVNIITASSDVINWKVTSTLKDVKITSTNITLNYDKANVWPGRGTAGNEVNANPWIFVKKDGKWYGATFEWLRPGQITKSIKSVSGSHIKDKPLNTFEPKKGETYGFMVSGLARHSQFSNVKERTNIVMVTWP